MNELKNVFSEPTTPTIGPLIDWPRYWTLLREAQEENERLNNLHVADWLIERTAFSNDGVRMVARN